MGTVSFPGVMRPGRGADHPPPSSAEVKRVRYVTLPPPPSSEFSRLLRGTRTFMLLKLPPAASAFKNYVFCPQKVLMGFRMILIINSDYFRKHDLLIGLRNR
jgi:hypothetical protein